MTSIAFSQPPDTPPEVPPIPIAPPPHVRFRNQCGVWFGWLSFASTWFGMLVLAVLTLAVAYEAWGSLSFQFLTRYDSTRSAAIAGPLAGLWGSFWLMILTALISIPIGIGAAVYLEEYAPGTFITRLIQINISNLAGIPSIVYGILGLTVFVRMFGLFPAQQPSLLRDFFLRFGIPLPFGNSVISGALTLSLLVLPVVIIATQEALRTVPVSVRHGALALGATKWQTIWHQVLPAATPGILTGVILALSRAIGETAPLIVIGIPLFIRTVPGGFTFVNPDLTGLLKVPFDMFTALPIIVYSWVTNANPEFRSVAAAGILVLLASMLLMNLIAILIRYHYQKQIRW